MNYTIFYFLGATCVLLAIYELAERWYLKKKAKRDRHRGLDDKTKNLQ
jgi:hypothetical protein